RDADLEPVDREEVEELDERDAEHAEGGEEEELAARGAQRARPRGEHDRGESRERARAAGLRQSQGVEAGGEDRLRDCAVEAEEDRRRHDHRVSGCRPALGGDARRGQVGRVGYCVGKWDGIVAGGVPITIAISRRFASWMARGSPAYCLPST